MALSLDFSPITTTVDYADVILGTLAILGALAVAIVAYNGGRMLVDAIRGAAGDEYEPDGDYEPYYDEERGVWTSRDYDE